MSFLSFSVLFATSTLQARLNSFLRFFLSCRKCVSFILKLFMAAIFLFRFRSCCSASLISRVQTFNFGFVLRLLLVLVVCWAELISISVNPRIADSRLHV